MSDFDRKGGAAARAAWLYYREDFTQGEIARELAVSRSTVTRLLQRAKHDGLVQILLNVTSATFQAERDLERAYGLDRVRIVPNPNNRATLKRWLGQVAGEVLVPMVAETGIVAVSWGTTMLATADSLIGHHPVPGAQVVAMVGGLHNATTGTGANEVANQMGKYFGAAVRPMLAPIYVQSEATALALSHDPGIRDALKLAAEASVVVYSVGAMDDEATMFKLGHVDAEQKEFLRTHGAVGDLACRWINRDGKPVELPPSINPIGISLDDLRKIPSRVAVAGDESKQEVVLACLRGGFATTLVTDERTADFLLAKR
jgi:DNA-binding transcriptional regulator LsrR (DeoR family)